MADTYLGKNHPPQVPKIINQGDGNYPVSSTCRPLGAIAGYLQDGLLIDHLTPLKDTCKNKHHEKSFYK